MKKFTAKEAKKFLLKEWGKYSYIYKDKYAFEEIYASFYHVFLESRANHRRCYNGGEINDYVSHSPNLDYFEALCFCEETQYKPRNVFHFTIVPCKEAEIVYCVRRNRKKLEFSEHTKGECPYTKYRYEKEE